MNILKRIATSVHRGVDRTVSSMENHEAVVDATLRASREALMRAKLRLAKLEKDGRQLQDRVTELGSEIELWTERAQDCADNNRQKALACLQRKKQREQELQHTSEQLTHHEQVLKGVRSSIDESANRVEALQIQRNHMRSREAAAQAGAIVHTIDDPLRSDVESAIERWEIKVGQSEILNDSYSTIYSAADELAEEFVTTEENQLLETELDELLKQRGSSSHD